MKNNRGFTLIELIGVVTLLALIALVVYPAINTVIKNSKEKAYNDQIEVVIKAAKQWGLEHADELPDEGGGINVSISQLLKGGYISNDEVIDPRETNKKLTGSVLIRYTSNQYVYTYSTDTFKSGMAEFLRTTYATSLTDDAYKGSSPNNYITFNGELWRIVKINSDDTVKIIRNDIAFTRSFDDNGGNDYKESTLNTYLNSAYYNGIKENNLITSGTFCIGALDSNICSSNITAKVGLLDASEYVEASSNSGCTLTNISACSSSNYLSLSGKNYYTMTKGDNLEEDTIYRIDNGTLTEDYQSYANGTKTKFGIRPVVNLKSTVNITGGTGTSDDPFKVVG